MEKTPENITSFRTARWHVRAAKIATAMCGGWPFSDGVHTEEYARCIETLREAERHLATFPQEWLEIYDELKPTSEEPPSFRASHLLGDVPFSRIAQSRGE